MKTCPKDCPNRCADPNCHNVDTCEIWASFQQAQALKCAERSKRRLMKDYIAQKRSSARCGR